MRTSEIFKLSPAGTAECSPGRQSWVCATQTKSPVGTTESYPGIIAPVIFSRPYGTPRAFKSYPGLRPGLHSAVPAGLSPGSHETLKPVPFNRSLFSRALRALSFRPSPRASCGIHLQLRLAMAAGGSTRVPRKAKAVEDRAKRHESHEQHSQVKVTQLGRGR